MTVWDTTDVANPIHLKTITPSPGSTGEYRGVHVYKGSPTATDGDVCWGNIQDGKVYVYRAPDLEGANPTPVKVFDTANDGIVGPHYFLTRPNTNEVWSTLRTAKAHGKLIRINGDTRTIITTPTATLETTSTPGDSRRQWPASSIRSGGRHTPHRPPPTSLEYAPYDPTRSGAHPSNLTSTVSGVLAIHALRLPTALRRTAAASLLTCWSVAREVAR